MSLAAQAYTSWVNAQGLLNRFALSISYVFSLSVYQISNENGVAQ